MRNIIVLLILVLTFSCATRKIMRNGVLVPYDRVLREDFQKCERAKIEKRYEDAKHLLNKFIKNFSDSKLIDDAHYMLGGIYYRQNDFHKAAKHFQKIITRYSSSDLLPEVSFSLASSYYQLAEYRKSYIVLRKIDEGDASSPLRLKIYYLLAKNAQNLNAHYQSIIWYLKARKISKNKNNVAKINNEVVKLIEERLTKEELLSLADKFSGKFPSSYINYKLGKEYFQNLNPEQAKFYLDKLMKSKGANTLSSNYISDAGDLLARIESHEKIIKNRIGVILPLSGQFERFGRKALHGIELAAGIYNNRSSAYEVELVIADSKNDPAIATAEVKRLLFKEHVSAIIGPLLSSTSLEVAAACEKLGLPNISLSQKNGVPETGEYTSRLALTNRLQIQTLAEYAVKKLGISHFAILHSSDSYGNEMANLFWDEVLKYGGEITEIESYTPKETNFRYQVQKISGRYYKDARNTELAQIKAELSEKLGRKPRHNEVSLPPDINFEAIFIPSFPKEIGQIAPHLSSGDIEGITLLGTNGWNSPNVVKRAQEYIEGAIFVDGFFNKSPYGVVRDFSTTYFNTFKSSPGIIEANAYDAADILINILSQTSVENRSEIQNALARVVNYPGVTGSITFSETGEAERPLFILTVENENIVQVN